MNGFLCTSTHSITFLKVTSNFWVSFFPRSTFCCCCRCCCCCLCFKSWPLLANDFRCGSVDSPCAIHTARRQWIRLLCYRDDLSQINGIIPRTKWPNKSIILMINYFSQWFDTFSNSIFATNWINFGIKWEWRSWRSSRVCDESRIINWRFRRSGRLDWSFSKKNIGFTFILSVHYL